MSSVIYDFGSNNGDDIPYYLQKAERVVAVEANPALASRITTRFSAEVNEGKLLVLNCALSVDSKADKSITFFVHKRNDHLSTIVPPAPEQASNFDAITVQTRDPVEVIAENGSPHFVKIDIEHYDHVIIKHLFSSGVYPEFISAEFHDVRVLAQLICCEEYQSFNIVEGHNVSRVYRESRIKTLQGSSIYSFPEMSAGPFGSDISSPWMSRKSVLLNAAKRGVGWRDIHASRNFRSQIDEILPDDSGPIKKLATLLLPPVILNLVRSIRRTLRSGKK